MNHHDAERATLTEGRPGATSTREGLAAHLANKLARDERRIRLLRMSREVGKASAADVRELQLLEAGHPDEVACLDRMRRHIEHLRAPVKRHAPTEGRGA